MNHLNTEKELVSLRRAIRQGRDPRQRCIAVCGGSGCLAAGGAPVMNSFREEVNRRGLKDDVLLRLSGCHGLCELGPLVVVYPERIFYKQVSPEDVPDIVSYVLGESDVVERLLYTDEISSQTIRQESEIPFYKKQTRLVFANNGLIDPSSVEDYIGIDGYSSFCKALFKMSRDAVIEEVIASGLRGRGGGGFPTGWKWQSARAAKGRNKYVICNADEGDPGAYMDRSIMEGNPHSVIEGMLIGAYAVGASEGYVYIRTEYPLAIERLETAIASLREIGLLGNDILGSGFSFDIRVSRGSGAFVCGESSALIASIEGNPGEPRAKHIHMSESGLFDKPTVLNNVETWANIPIIIGRGSKWFSGIGTAESTGTKLFSLVGNVRNSGLVEVAMGMTLGEIVNDIGGGVPDGRTLKAVQTGGPSGGCIPADLMNIPVDFDSLSKAGSMMGSGGMIVMDDTACMVDVARYFIEFLVDESCGKCSSCREGLKHLYAVLSRICAGKGQDGDIELLKDLCDVVQNASLCGLGTSAPNPVLSTLKYFPDEYEAHIREHRCPAKVCKAMLHFRIIAENCTGCGACLKKCPSKAISGERKEPHAIDMALCVKCGQCSEVCRFDAVEVS